MSLLYWGLFFYISIRRAVTLPESHGKGFIRKSPEMVSSQMNSSSSSCCSVCLFLSYPYAPCPDSINNADTLRNFHWKLSGDLTKGKYS